MGCLQVSFWATKGPSMLAFEANDGGVVALCR